ncbi:MAG: hypothetical protein PHC34_13300 [Candidatus Gastranaerophilales bacterium]|nr:hypothetical protein [Candidatus Gastranaerophilales bacterium]
MDKFEIGVPFDPGYSQYSFSFLENIGYITQEYSQLKANHQKKFKLSLIEPTIIDLIKKCTAFYLGCILWGGFIHYRFKDSPKEIIGNNTKDLTDDELKELDCAEETKYMLKYIEQFKKDCKYFLRRPARVSDIIVETLKSYNEFVELNNNFADVNNTGDVKLPQILEHFKKLTDEQLNDLYIKISKIIESGKIEDLLEIGFYRI